MAPKRGRNPRQKVRMETRAPPLNTHGLDALLSVRGGDPVASSRPLRLGGPRRRAQALGWVAAHGWGEARARGAASADGTVVVMGTRVTARATQCGTESRAAGLRRLATGRVGDATPMARRQEGGEGQRVLWRLPDAQLNSGSSTMSTRAATPDCSGEGAMMSSYNTLYVRIRGGAQGSVDEVSHPSADCECAL